VFGRSRVAQERLWIPAAALEEMAAAADLWAPQETGGALMGYESEDGLVITHLIDAGPEAQRTATGFSPDPAFQLEAIGHIYARSGRIHTYIGDWHSHPNGSPMHSSTDRAAVREISRSREARCERPLMIIIGEDDGWSAVAWRFEPGLWLGRVAPMAIELY